MKKSAIVSEEPFSGVTTPIFVKPNINRVEAVIKSSRALYTKPYVLKRETFIFQKEEEKAEKSKEKPAKILP